MIGRKAIIGLSLLCALAFNALTASGAMAETKTTTAFTCKKKAEPGGSGFSKEHCREADAVASAANFEHVEIAPLTWTSFDATNEKTNSETNASTAAVLKGKITGLGATITAKSVTATGEVENFTATPGSGEMDIKQRHVIIHFSEVTLSGAVVTVLGCKLSSGTITTNELESTSLRNTMEAEYKPEAGLVFATIGLEGCIEPADNKNYPIEGTLKAIGDGATVETTAVSSAGLTWGGQPASLTMKVTPRMTFGTTTENPIGSTTIVDP